MRNKVKDIDIKNRIFYIFNDIIKTEHFNLNNIKVDKMSFKNIFMYYTGYVTIK